MSLDTEVESRPFELREHHENILALLRLKPRTSLELSAVCVSYGSRVSELRRAGYDIRAKRVAGRLFEYELFLKPIGDGHADAAMLPVGSSQEGQCVPERDEGRVVGVGGGVVTGGAERDPAHAHPSGDDVERGQEVGAEADARDGDRAPVTGLALGRWEEVLAGVEVDAVITDGPYSARVHAGHGAGMALAEVSDGKEDWERKYDGANPRRVISYENWTVADVDALIDSWAPRTRGWLVCLSDHAFCGAYEAAYQRHGLTTFAPVGVLIPGMTVRMAGDGPSSWMLYANVARPKRLSKWGTLPGGYTGPPGERVHIGGKALWLMRALVRDYSRPGDLVCDPCAGAASTLIAAVQEGRRCIGAEVDPVTWKIGAHRLATALSMPSFNFEAPPVGVQESLFGGGQ